MKKNVIITLILSLEEFISKTLVDSPKRLTKSR